MRVGVVGVGVISAQYFSTLARLSSVRIVAVADLDAARAAAVAGELGVTALTVDELLASPDVDTVLNLTIPAAHVEVGLAALAAGKHVYAEKPLALSTDSARQLLDSRGDGLRIGSAPDTVLGTGIQTARRAVDDGLIGTPVGAAVHWSGPGHELWHPAPDFYYAPGGGPLFDMGPYYLTSLVTILGPVARVIGVASRSDRERTIATGARTGAAVKVDVDTHVSALLVHASGVTTTLTVSFEEWATRIPLFEIHGTTGSLSVPDPNYFSEPVSLATAEDPAWRELPMSAGYRDAGRGAGLADLAASLESGAAHRASAELAFHVLEIMEKILESSSRGVAIELTSTVERAEPVSLGDLR